MQRARERVSGLQLGAESKEAALENTSKVIFLNECFGGAHRLSPAPRGVTRLTRLGPASDPESSASDGEVQRVTNFTICPLKSSIRY